MNYKLRLNTNEIYISDLKIIIDSIKVNGNKAKCHNIVISHPKGNKLTLFMNFALEQNSSYPPINTSLNILGFKNSNGEPFLFDINPFPCDNFFDKEVTKLKIDGSYKNLGYPMELPKITITNLFESIDFLSNYKVNAIIGEQEYNAITRLIIATSEAIRFSSVANGISNILENNAAFTPNYFEIIGWGGHSIAS